MKKLIVLHKKAVKKGIALVIFMIVMLILFILFGALTYRVQTSMLISRNNYIETQAEAAAQAASRHALSVISLVGFDNFPSNIIIDPPSNLSTANEPNSVPNRTYDLARDPNGNPPPNSLINNARLTSLSLIQLTPDFSYRVCTWQYDP
ncbi:MAG: hypothetical protein ACK4F9_07745, partial [Brevinematia bacterium]